MAPYLSHHDLQRMLIGAYLAVRDQKARINEANIFPVPDKDTGTNLTRTLRGVNAVVSKRTFDRMDLLRDATLEASLMSSAGNAGIIVTSYLGGFLSSLSDDVNQHELISAFVHGTDRAYASVHMPREGMILDAMHSVSATLQSLKGEFTAREILIHARDLGNTLTSSSRNHRGTKPDAGILGYVAILDGFVRGLDHIDLDVTDPTESDTSGPSQTVLYERRYEIVSVLEGPEVSHNQIVQSISSYGDSLDILRVNDRYKIHIHTDHPDEVIDRLQTLGSIVTLSKVDMNIGESWDTAPQRVGLLVDEGASLDRAFAQSHGIEIVPFQFEWEGESLHDPTVIYSKLRTRRSAHSLHTFPTTSQPSPGAFLAAFKRALDRYESLICILTSSRVSGTFTSALHARSLLDPALGTRILIPDLHQAVSGQSLLLHRAVRLIADGYQVSHIVHSLDVYSRSVATMGIGDDPFWLVAGGRISPIAAHLYRALIRIGLQPLVGIRGGKLGLMGIVHRSGTPASILSRYLKSICSHESEGVSTQTIEVVIHHADEPERASELADILSREHFRIIDIQQLSPVAGIHIGPGAVILSAGNLSRSQ